MKIVLVFLRHCNASEVTLKGSEVLVVVSQMFLPSTLLETQLSANTA